MLIAKLQTDGLQGLHCDRSFWKEDGFGIWATVFYVSKYYEFIDTWILVLKNSDGTKPPSFLQKYHHAGHTTL
jgi:hypothetical protein